MKKTTKRVMPIDLMTTRQLATADLQQVVGGDVYMHEPKGSNNSNSGGGGGGNGG
jgi:hypothetical protein